MPGLVLALRQRQLHSVGGALRCPQMAPGGEWCCLCWLWVAWWQRRGLGFFRALFHQAGSCTTYSGVLTEVTRPLHKRAYSKIR